MIPDSLRPYLARLVAGWVATLAVYLETRYQIILDPNTKAALVTGAVGIFGTVYPIVHRLIDKIVNPGDAASSHLASAEKAQVTAMKADEKALRP